MIRVILLFCILFSFNTEGIGQKEITLEDIWSKGTFSAKSLPGFRFLNDGQHYTRLDKQVIKKYTIVDGAHTSDIFDAQSWKDKNGFSGRIADYAFSHDENMVLILSESEGVYRHSTKNTVHLFHVQKETLTPIFSEGKISNPEISPDGSHIAFVFQNNLYVTNLATGKRIQITKDGMKNSIINGICIYCLGSNQILRIAKITILNG
jgi:dipeptidyl-peptidase-4